MSAEVSSTATDHGIVSSYTGLNCRRSAKSFRHQSAVWDTRVRCGAASGSEVGSRGGQYRETKQAAVVGNCVGGLVVG